MIQRSALLLLAALCAVANAKINEASEHPAINGKAIYEGYCQGCHGTFERSNEPFFPALTKRAHRQPISDFVTTVLTGRVRWVGDYDHHSNGNMPALDYLANEEIAAVVNYLYDQAGVKTAPTTVEAVALARADLSVHDHDIVLSSKQYNEAERLYLNLCAGCHGLDRRGLSGAALEPSSLKDLSPAEILKTLHYGTSLGMPNWGTANTIEAEQLVLLSRYLKLEPQRAPEYSFSRMLRSWNQITPAADRPERKQSEIATKNLFISLLHDTGQVALINQASRTVRQLINTDLAPHDITMSNDGRYLYVLARSGHVAMIDLYAKMPVVVARVRIAYSARNLALSTGEGPAVLVVGSHAGVTVSALDANSLQPLTTTSVAGSVSSADTQAIVDLQNVPGTNRFVVVLRGHSGLIELALQRSNGEVQLARSIMGTTPALRAGSFDLSNRYFLAPADDLGIAVFDLHERRQVTLIDMPGRFGGTQGNAYVDPEFGPVWTMGSLSDGQIVVVGTDPAKHPQQAWKVVRTLELPGAGPLFMAVHSESSHLWTDMTLNARPGMASSVVAVDRKDLIGKRNVLQLRHALPERFNQITALHPQFDSSGKEVWVTLWNRQDLPSAIVVLNDASMTVAAVIKDARLITPVRTFSASSLIANPALDR